MRIVAGKMALRSVGAFNLARPRRPAARDCNEVMETGMPFLRSLAEASGLIGGRRAA